MRLPISALALAALLAVACGAGGGRPAASEAIDAGQPCLLDSQCAMHVEGCTCECLPGPGEFPDCLRPAGCPPACDGHVPFCELRTMTCRVR